MKAMRAPNGFPPQPNIFTENKGRGLAKRTFTDSLTLGSGNDRVELRYFGRGHTNGDAWVFFPALRIVHSGDIFAGKAMPFFDTNNGGSGVEIPDSLTKAANAMSAVDSIVTGHGGVITVADLREYAQANREFVDNAHAAKKAGRAPADAAKAWSLPAKYTGYTIDRMRVQIAMETIYKELP
jgi:cyclase